MMHFEGYSLSAQNCKNNNVAIHFHSHLVKHQESMIIHQGKLWIICDIYSSHLKLQVVLSKYLFVIELNLVPDTFINLSIKN